MRVGAIPETLIERIALATGAVPTPIVDTLHAVIVARAIVTATRLDVFEALADAGERGHSPRRLPQCRRAGNSSTSRLGRLSRPRRQRLCAHAAVAEVAPRRQPTVAPRLVLLRLLEWRAIDTTEAFVRTGNPLGVHDIIQGDQWNTYQRGMHAWRGSARARSCAG
jgi:hypothetical protein